MSWADKQLKKYKLRKQIKEIMDSPEFQKERQKELDKHTAEVLVLRDRKTGRVYRWKQ